MASDDLNRPLGLGRRAPDSSRSVWSSLWGRRGLALGLASLAIAAIGAAFVAASPRGGEPFAVSAIPAAAPERPDSEDRQPTGSILRQPTSQTAKLDAATGRAATENGVSVYRGGRPGERPSGGPLVIKVPEALGQSEILPVDKRLIEQTRYGPLPRISVDGLRSSDYYARPLVFTGPVAAGTPRIALVVGGAEAPESIEAALHLPAAVSLVFAPYAETLDQSVSRAKAAGHEVLLSLAMDEAPGNPHRLVSSATKPETIDTLRWLMGRMAGYVGVSVHSDAAIPADRAAIATILTEVDQRGLLFIDNDTRATGVAPGQSLPFGRADVALDARADPAMQRAACLKLEAIARAKGFAIGMITALPANPEALKQFIESLDAKGMVLVPVSALAKASVQPVATMP